MEVCVCKQVFTFINYNQVDAVSNIGSNETKLGILVSDRVSLILQ